MWVLYRLSDAVSRISIAHCLRDLPHRKPSLTNWLDTKTNKPLQVWQDRATLLSMVILTVVAIPIAFSGPVNLARVGAIISSYSLFVDTVNYFVRVLWFDDLTPGIQDERRAVWSHRRILFFALLGYLQSIMLFSAIYRLASSLHTASFLVLLQRSFFTATFTNLARFPGLIDAIQILTSLFFIAVVIAVISASGYQRSEISKVKDESA